MCTGSSSCRVEGQYFFLSESNGRYTIDSASGSSPCLDSSSNYLPSDPNAVEQGENNEVYLDIPNVPLSSSPPDLTSSSPCSANDSDESDSEETSTSDSSLSNISSGSPLDLTTTEGFGQKLHQLLLVALQERKLRDKTNFSFYSDSSLLQTPDISSFSCVANQGDQEACLGQAASSEEISPIHFETSQNVVSSQYSLSDQKSKIPANYRIIKRALSNGLFEPGSEQLTKRQKHGRDGSIRAHDQVYARRTASIRRAESLKSVDSDLIRTPLAPTVPTTPTPTRKPHNSTVESLLVPVPVIAPPVDHAAKLPMSSGTFAKICLERLLQREAESRKTDGLPSGISARPPSCMLQNRSEDYPFDDDDECSVEDDIRFDWEVVIGLGSKRRKTIVAWLLQVLPVRSARVTSAPPLSPSSPSNLLSSESTSCSSLSSDSSYFGTGDDLYDQLHNSAETRFHAVWMFLRFFFLKMPPDSQMQSWDNPGTPKSSNGHRSRVLEQEGLGLISWDMAVACLSLSVKFHRDFLNPLVPVYAHEYVMLAPHTLSYGDLEAAHRDILSAFDYRLGITPQSVLDQLWLALPSLRSVLDFEGGWKKTTLTAWSYLFSFLREPDVQRFPISILTAVSLMDGILESLAHLYHSEFYSSDMYTEDGLDHSLDEEAFDTPAVYDKCKDRAKENAEGVFCDIQALIGITDAQLLECRLWVSRID